MAVWLVRAGKHGEHEALALDQGVSVIGWDELPDLKDADTREKLETLMRKAYPDAAQNAIANYVGQVWAFRGRIKEGDLVILPLKSRPAVAVGRIKGPYKYRPSFSQSARHTRATEWDHADIPRTRFDQDLLYSLGAFMTVCQIQRHDAEHRIRAILEGKSGVKVPRPEPEPPEENLDIEQFAQDQLKDFVARRFKGHDLARLVNEILKAQGYVTHLAPPGADSGADILAGSGPMGFNPPRLCVQVKSSDSPVEVGGLRDLQGTLKNLGAEQGLLVAWGGFKSTVLSEARRVYFEVRLWHAGDLIDNLLSVYDKLPTEVQTELPLKRIWALVPEGVDDGAGV